jgi:hypothetical protein
MVIIGASQLASPGEIGGVQLMLRSAPRIEERVAL